MPEDAEDRLFAGGRLINRLLESGEVLPIGKIVEANPVGPGERRGLLSERPSG